jgi:hypothetical protein
MKDVQCNQEEDVSKWKPFPESMFNGFHVCVLTCNMKLMDVTLSQKIDIDHHALFMPWECFIFTKLVGWNGAFGAPATVCASHKDLFRVVADKSGEDWVALVPDTITAHHHDSCFAAGHDWT